MGSEFKFDDLTKRLRETLDDLPDYRTGNNVQYSIKDAALGAYGAFFTQSLSFLAYQRDLERRQGNSNAYTLPGAQLRPRRTVLIRLPCYLLIPGGV
jgi:hypothetical protein